MVVPILTILQIFEGLCLSFLAMRSRIYGVDFSGAQKAGKKIWIAEVQHVVFELFQPVEDKVNCYCKGVTGSVVN